MLKKPSPSAITFKKFLQRVKRFLQVEETALLERRFDVYRADTGAVLARGIDGYEAAKQHATRLRKQLGLKWAQVKFKSASNSPSSSSGTVGGSRTSGSQGHQVRLDVAPRINPSKGRRFRGYYDSQGNYHDID